MSAPDRQSGRSWQFRIAWGDSKVRLSDLVLPQASPRLQTFRAWVLYCTPISSSSSSHQERSRFEKKECTLPLLGYLPRMLFIPHLPDLIHLPHLVSWGQKPLVSPQGKTTLILDLQHTSLPTHPRIKQQQQLQSVRKTVLYLSNLLLPLLSLSLPLLAQDRTRTLLALLRTVVPFER